MRYKDFFSSFVPPLAETDEWRYRRQRIFVGVCFVSALYAILYIPLVIQEEYYGALTVIIVFAAVNILLPFLLKRGIPLPVLVNIYLLTMAISESRILTISG